jgi:DNA-binding IscR family transcriptional regulator
MTLPILLQPLSGKAAVFVRGMIHYVCSHEPARDIPLRKAQAAGMAAVDELGETISVPYVSKLTKLLESADIVTKARKGKGYVLNLPSDTTALDQVIDHMGSEWGTMIEKEASEATIRMRSAMIDHMTDVGHVRIEAEEPIDKVAYQVLIEKFKAGQYDMVFVHRDMGLIDESNYPVNTIHASVANR